MGDQLIARKTQTLTKNWYMPGNCVCGQCSVGSDVPDCFAGPDGIHDWTAEWEQCCGGFCRNQRKCVHIDRDECNIGLNSKGQDPLIDIAWDGEAPRLKCTYDLGLIDKISQVDAFENIFGKNDTIVGAYCEQPVNTCPEGLKTCSRFKSTGEGSNRCRDWYANLHTDYLRDVVAQNYCFRHNTDDCRCVNRSLTEEYMKLKKGNPIDDKCWFVPCANPLRYFVPSDLTKGSCPENVCEIIFDIYKDRDVTIYDNDITCSFGPQPGPNPIVLLFEEYWAIPVLILVLFSMWMISRN